MAFRIGRGLRKDTSGKEIQGKETQGNGKRAWVDDHIPNPPFVPEPEPGDEVGVAGGPVRHLVSEFSWADEGGEENNLHVAGRTPKKK